MSAEELIIEGARQNNLKNISLKLPHNKLIVVTGVSGSGKSSLAFDTIFAEGQWRFILSLSTYARLFLEKLDRPDVDKIRNIRPAIALEQRNSVKSSRSTVGTATEIYDYLRLLYSKIAQPHCPKCGRTLKAWTTSSAVKELVEKYSDKKAFIIFDTDNSAEELQTKGFHRVLINGETKNISGLGNLKSAIKNQKSYSVVLDRLVIKDEPRLSDSVETAWEYGEGRVKIEFADEQGKGTNGLVFSSKLKCLDCGIEIAKPQPLLFSFNHPLGACPECKGFGNTLEYNEDTIVPDQDLSLEKGAIEPWSKPAYKWWYRQFVKAAKTKKIKLNVPYKKLPKKVKELIFKGDADFYGLDDFFQELEKKRYKLHVRVFLSRYRKAVTCGTCEGTRLRPEALAFTIGGLNIARLSGMSISRLHDHFSSLRLTEYEDEVSSEIRRQIRLKLEFLLRVGMGYLPLDRQSKTLSGGESQRINLANQLASKLTGTLYVLDEPTVGLHPRDIGRIIEIIRELADLGNTILTVEHDKKVIDSADWIVELGPGGGNNGGRLVFSGPRSDFLRSGTLTANYLNNSDAIPVPAHRRKARVKMLSIKGASGHNLKNIDVSFPLYNLIGVTGVSGSGKSTVIKETLYKAVAKAFKVEFENPLPYKSIKGLEYLKGVRIIDQRPIGRSPRSNPVTYVKAFDPVRKLFAGQIYAKNLGYGPGHFSFNVEGGRCEACKGVGFQKLEMYFFEDLYIKCEECEGKRYRPEVLSVTYNGKNIHEVLELTVDEAIKFFPDIPPLTKKFRLMASVGLGYLRLGQPATTLSGGEAQRLKICAELGIASRRDYLYILDEPTVGLHPEDIKKMLYVLNELVDAGNTVVLVEHNLDVIKNADWVIDLGPEGGEQGGEIIAQGKPEDIVKHGNSYTGRYLKEYL
ncbi:UvrABC system protein A [bacterium BMS3Bbin08]|nr:UvrABC system protein A [bacterium BMS3Bbin08]